MKKIVISLLVLMVLVVPAVVLAQGPRPDFNYTNDWATQLIEWSKTAVTFLMVIATLYFIWTVIQYIRVKEAKDAEEKKKAMIRGIIGLFVIVAIWGIVRVISTTLGVSGTSTQTPPCPPGLVYNVALRVCQ
jgi:Na+/proline symporter